MICPICNKTYEVEKYKIKTGRGTSCSRDCSYKLRAKKQKSNQIEHECSVCKKKVMRNPSHVGANIFCSNKCSNKQTIYPINHQCGLFTVISSELKRINNKFFQHCRCVCGKETWIATYRLNTKNKGAVTCCNKCAKHDQFHEITSKYLIEQIFVKNKQIKEIAKEIGCSVDTITQRMKDNNILLPKSESHFLEGKVFGKWTVLEKIIKKSKQGWQRIYYKCKCKCGYEKHIWASSLLKKYSTQCIKCSGKNKRKNKSKHWKGYEEISGQFWNQYKTAAAARQIIFNITQKYSWDLFLNQNKKCALTGESLEMPQRNYINKNLEGSASIDRIDSKIGYIEGNIQWVLKDINRMKWDIPEKQFIEFCSKIIFWKHNKHTIERLIDKYDIKKETVTKKNNFPKILTGLKIGSWKIGEQTIIKCPSRKDRGYHCICNCGNAKPVSHYNLIIGKSKMCPECSLKNSFGLNSIHFKGHKGIIGDYWGKIKRGAKKRNILFEIKIEEAWEKWLSQGGVCIYTGEKLRLKTNTADKEWTASIDRINSTKSYNFENIQWIHKDINRMKLEFDENKFITLCEKVVRKHTK